MSTVYTITMLPIVPKIDYVYTTIGHGPKDIVIGANEKLYFFDVQESEQYVAPAWEPDGDLVLKLRSGSTVKPYKVQ